MAQIYVKRAKIFMTNEGKRVAVAPGNPVKVPDWVRNTPTWQPGIDDGSILDITPTKAPIAEPEADELEEAQPVTGDNNNPGDDGDGQVVATTGKTKPKKAAAGLQ